MTAQKANKAAVLGAKRREKRVHYEELDCELLFREMTGDDTDSYAATNRRRVPNAFDEKTNEPVYEQVMEGNRKRLVARSLIDEETGSRMFGDDEIDELGQLPTSVLDRMTKDALEVNGMSAEDIEEAVGNSEATTGDDSSFDSPSQ